MTIKTSIKKIFLWIMLLIGIGITYYKMTNKDVVYSATFVGNCEDEKGDLWKYT